MHTSLVSGFEQTAARFPAKIAIGSGGARIRFADLNRAANAIAGSLLAGECGSSPPSRVALLFEDRIAAVAALLGVLKAGHAYVMLDATDPPDRVQFILQDCEPLALITDDAHLARSRPMAPADCRVISLNALQLNVPPQPLPAVPPDALAYLCYTSGSTGQPKGVCQTHHNLLYYVEAYRRTLGIHSEDRLSFLLSLSYAASDNHLYCGLLTGATLCPGNLRRSSSAALADWLEREQVTVLSAVPSIFRHLTRGLPPQRKFPRVRAVDLAGESLFAGDVALFRRHFSEECRLINHLGATEAGTIAQHVVGRDEPAAGTTILPVGRCPDGMSVRICRTDGTEAAVDETGEIVISSPFHSPGYWRRPELTAAAFSDDPDRPGCRLYRARDLGRIDRQQNLVFVGRTGARVKIRGQLVELAEVEAALRQTPGIADATVIAPTGPERPEADRLVAHVVASGAGHDAKSIRRELATRLPAYMVPADYVFHESLPRTASGKVDPGALAQSAAAGAAGDSFQPPRDELEKKVAAAFQEVLDCSPVGSADDFFLLGGDSLSATELQVRLVNLFGRNVPNVFEETTVAGIAAAIRRRAAAPAEEKRLMPVLLPRRAQGTTPILFLVHGRRGQAQVGGRFLELLGADQPLYVFQARGVDGIQRPHETIEAMAADYISAMRTVQERGPYFLAGLCSGGIVVLAMAQHLRERGEQVGPLILIDPPVPPYTQAVAAESLRALGPGLRALQQRGEIEIDFTDPDRRRGARDVAVRFENALLKHRLMPYDGLVFLLASKEKLTETGWGREGKLQEVFSGDVQCYEVGARHTEILDANNEDFARHLAHCVQAARDAMRMSQPESDPVADSVHPELAARS
jgi:amino acid adenylation domain-containing protein